MKKTFLQGNLEYRILTEDTASKTGTVSVIRTNEDYGTTLNIPSSIERNGIIYTITQINRTAFPICWSLESITIPEGVTRIGEWAFFLCTGLVSITIPKSVTRIGEGVFFGCTGLVSITIPESVTRIGKGAFFGCTGLVSITIPKSVTRIGEGAFADCENLTDVYFKGVPPKTDDRAFEKGALLHYIRGISGRTPPRWNGFENRFWKFEE